MTPGRNLSTRSRSRSGTVFASLVRLMVEVWTWHPKTSTRGRGRKWAIRGRDSSAFERFQAAVPAAPLEPAKVPQVLSMSADAAKEEPSLVREGHSARRVNFARLA